jgi:DegV family protein with EDD domain
MDDRDTCGIILDIHDLLLKGSKLMVNIITDTTSCLSPEVAKRYNIPVIPQIINFGDESFYEGTQMDTAAFMARLRASSTLPKTAAPPPELFVEEFKRLISLSEPILCIHPSIEISGTVRSAMVAAKEFPNADIRIIDTRLVASPLGTLVELAAEWAAKGADADTIEARVKEYAKRCRLYFLVATLEYLARGGRIGGATHLLGSMLQIKPILCLSDGRVDQYERERTQKRAIARLKEIVIEQAPLDGNAYLSVMHADALEEARGLALDLSQQINQPHISIVSMPPAIITHGGPGILGVGFFVKE